MWRTLKTEGRYNNGRAIEFDPFLAICLEKCWHILENPAIFKCLSVFFINFLANIWNLLANMWKLSENISTGWNSRFQHSGFSARLPSCLPSEWIFLPSICSTIFMNKTFVYQTVYIVPGFPGTHVGRGALSVGVPGAFNQSIDRFKEWCSDSMSALKLN